MQPGSTSALSSPIRIGAKTAKNRFVLPAMGTGYASPDGMVTQQILDYYNARARGGPGIVIVETATVEFPRGIHASNKLVADTDLAIPGLAELAKVIRAHGAVPLLQLSHAGRMASTKLNGIPPVAPSSIAAPGGEVPRALTIEEIGNIVRRFGAAARRAMQAGFDGCEVHAAHGYLLATFASKASNKRTDEYGGDIENRARFLVEALVEMRRCTNPDFVLSARINAEEYGDADALTLFEGKQLAALIEPHVNIISVSVRGYGAHSLVNYPDHPGELLPVAEAIKKHVKTPIIAVGRMNASFAEAAIAEGRADLIALGRQSIADPETPNLILSGRSDEVRPCIACFYCADWGAKIDKPIGCQVNADVGKEREYVLRPAERRKKVVVIGAGPAGLEASRVLAARGHEVILLEKEPFIGGQLAQAVIPPHKDRLAPLLSYFSRNLQKLGVEIRTSVYADVKQISALHPDVVLFAGGAKPAVPRIPGVDLPHVTNPLDILYNRTTSGETAVIVGGGLTGCEVAEYLDEQGVKVTLVHPYKALAHNAGSNERARAIAHLQQRPVSILLNSRCVSISADGVEISHPGDPNKFVPAKTVVLASGVVPDNQFYVELLNEGLDVHMMGDCWRPGMIATAVADGARWGHAI